MGKRKALKNQGSEFRKDMKNGGGTGFIRKKNWTFSVTGCGKDCNSDMNAGGVFGWMMSHMSG